MGRVAREEAIRALAIAAATFALVVASSANGDGATFADAFKDGYNQAAAAHGWPQRLTTMDCGDLQRGVYRCDLIVRLVKGPHAGVSVCIRAVVTSNVVFRSSVPETCWM